jgi:nicotinamidase-related amidase
MNKQHAEQEVARRETRSTLLDPITPENAVLLLVDQQEGLFARIYEPEQTRRQLLGLARSTQLLGVPAVLTTALATGPNGPMLDALTTIFDGAEVLDRTVINAWRDPRVHEAIMRTGRQKVIIAGTGFDICAQLPALSAVAEGYDTYVVIDACGRFDPLPSVATITRLAQAGVALVNARTIVLEMMADNAHPKAKEIYSALPPGLVTQDQAPGA